MATNSSTSKNEKYPSVPSTMIKTSQTPLAQLRPDRLDDDAIQKQISLIEQACGNVDQNLIAIVFHECGYDLRSTIARLKSGAVVEDGGWRSAKPSNKKKTNVNNGTTSNNEHQVTSPPSTRSNPSNYRRQDHYYHHPPSSRGYPNRRGFSNSSTLSNPRYNNRQLPKAKKATTSEPIESNPATTEQRSPSSTSNDEFEFPAGTTQSLTFDNSKKKSNVSTKVTTSSTIPHEPVSMHPSVQYSASSLDIQFGDVQWNDSNFVIVTPTEELEENETLSKKEENSSNINEILSKTEAICLSVETDTNVSASKLDDTSTVSNPLNETNEESQGTTSFNLQLSSNSTTSAPIPTNLNSTGYSSPTHHQNHNIQSHSIINNNASAFTPYNGNQPTYQSTQGDYTLTAATPTTISYKTMQTTNLPLGATYAQPGAAYSLPSQQQYFFNPYPFHPGIVPIIPPVDSWHTGNYQQTLESYATYPNYYSSYGNHQHYHNHHNVALTKYNQYPNSERDPNGTYVLTRPSTGDSTNASQSSKDLSSSNLSASAASFSQGASLTTGNPVGPYFMTHINYPMQSYVPIHSIDSRDNRSGGPHSSQIDRALYHQPRSRHQNPSWQTQQ